MKKVAKKRVLKKKSPPKKAKKAKKPSKKATKKSPKRKTASKKAKKSFRRARPKKRLVKKTRKTKKTPSSPRRKRVQRIRNALDKVRIKVFGVGGGGGNAISRMKRNAEIRGIEFIAVNTDTQDLENTDARKKINIGKQLTRGLGTGMNPDLGQQAAEENRADLAEAVKGADLIFITAGLGGGTGSGASPILAEVAKDAGALTIAIVTKPFLFEGSPRAQIADAALEKLSSKVDAIIVVPNDKIFEIIKKETPILKAFEKIDDVLKDAIKGISELISASGIINVDFSDIQSIMKDAGSALVGVGLAKGQNRAAIAANYALNSPLLEFSTEGAKGVLFGISGGRDVRMSEINEIARYITGTTDPNAKVIFGAYHDRRIPKGTIKVTLIATGFEDGYAPKDTVFEAEANPLFSSVAEAEEDEDIIDLTSESAQRQSLFKREKTVQEEKEAIADQPVDNSRRTKKDAKPRVRKRSRKDFSEEPTHSEKLDEEKESIWDIPAFLRKKKKDK